MRVLALLETVGNALLLQLMFVLCSVPIVSIAPAAIALQRTLASSGRGEAVGVRAYLSEFWMAWKQSWRIGVVFALIAIGFAAGLPFWLSISSPIGLVGFFVLVALFGLAIGTWLALLSICVDRPLTGVVDGVRQGFAQLSRRSLRGVAGVVIVFMWLALAGSIPTLLLIGAGLVPALVARGLMRAQPSR